MLKVIDVSQYNNITDHALLKQNAFAVLIKSSQGNWEDPTFRDKLAKERAVGQRVGIWHFYHPSMQAKDQIEKFLNIWHSLAQKPGKIALDCEESSWNEIVDGKKVTHTIFPPNVNTYSIWLAQWLAAVEEDTKIIPDIYTRATWWNPWVLPSKTVVNNTTLPDWSHYGLWVANYGVSKPSLPRDWKTWLFWQWGTSLTPGIQTPVDSDWFDGTEAQLDAVFKLQTPAPPSPDPTPEPTGDLVELTARVTLDEARLTKIEDWAKSFK